MRRYLIFVFDPDTPQGGWNDCVAAYDEYDAALFHFRAIISGWVQLVDVAQMKVLRSKLHRHSTPNGPGLH